MGREPASASSISGCVPRVVCEGFSVWPAVGSTPNSARSYYSPQRPFVADHCAIGKGCGHNPPPAVAVQVLTALIKAACDPHCQQPRCVSGDSLDHSWRRIELKLSVRCSMKSPTPATERLMANFSCAATKRMSHWQAPMSREAPVRFRVSVVVAALVLTGCNANREVNPSGQTDRCAKMSAAILTIPSATHRTTPGIAAAAAVEATSSEALKALKEVVANKKAPSDITSRALPLVRSSYPRPRLRAGCNRRRPRQESPQAFGSRPSWRPLGGGLAITRERASHRDHRATN
jgi:hypothetical protein